MPRNSPSTINMSVSRFYRMCNSIDNLLWLRLPSTCYQYARCKQWIFQLMRFRLRELTEAYRWNLSSIIQLELWDVRCHGSAVWWFGEKRYHLYRLSGPPQFRYPVPSDRGCRLSNVSCLHTWISNTNNVEPKAEFDNSLCIQSSFVCIYMICQLSYVLAQAPLATHEPIMWYLAL